jgi:hypothetical protein
VVRQRTFQPARCGYTLRVTSETFFQVVPTTCYRPVIQQFVNKL